MSGHGAKARAEGASAYMEAWRTWDMNGDDAHEAKGTDGSNASPLSQEDVDRGFILPALSLLHIRVWLTSIQRTYAASNQASARTDSLSTFSTLNQPELWAAFCHQGLVS